MCEKEKKSLFAEIKYEKEIFKMTEKIIYQFNGETYETREEAERAVYYYAEDI